ncbi:serine hydrolase domain-containing protein [Jannaschia ovalis]|uniref:Serine hydrolase n=1 Tax=Jannaschia ovalis TaxID=3038773 RepID=A0ABY8LG71_9RHOB|nr:serine hydrolase [Jannaschia sp. GRR-S6-38]WGH80306.1 serine hydrolase [Jannaschia sp. GRR-S6-38]
MRRRAALGCLGAALACPAILRAQTLPELRDSAAALDQLHSLIVWRGGTEVLAERFGGPGLDRVANVKSVSKTLLSLLVGIAAQRELLSVEDRVLPLLGRGPAGDARDAITVADLLSLRGGLASTSGPNYGAWVSSPNWVEYVLNQPLESEPGGRFIYSTGATHLLGAALSRAAEADLLTLARRWLGAPLGIDFAPWVADPQGNYLGGNDMALSPRDLGRVARMCLNRGEWQGRQVIDPAWFDRAWQPRARSPWSGDGYGYGWFLTRLGGTPVHYARGYGGQVMAVMPRIDTALVITSDPTRPARSGGYFGDLRDLMGRVAAA